jgi:IPT/TIG domain
MKKGLFALVASAVVLWPAAAGATTIRLGPEVPVLAEAEDPCLTTFCAGGRTWSQVVSPGLLDEAPASGVITSWRVSGEGPLRLRVLRLVGEEESELAGVGTSALATNTHGAPNATSLPIRAGDVIGVDDPAGTNSFVGLKTVAPSSAVLFEWEPTLPDGGGVRVPKNRYTEKELMLSADIVLAPVVSSVAPASGSTAGGNAVKITGLFFIEGGATGVTFGSTPASSFSIDSSSQITAIAPPSTASTVDVRVSGQGGSSEVTAADRYTFTGPPTTTGPAGGPALQPAKPTVTGFSESSSRWRRGHALPHVSSAGGAPVGTTFSFSLNEPASVNATFTQSVSGRRVAGRCAATGHRNAGRPRCKRTLVVGSFAVPGHAGLDSVRFQGRLSGSKTLKPGSYRVSLTARAGHGQKVSSRPLSFTIVS